MKWFKFREFKTNAERKFVPHMCMLGAGFCGGVFVHFASESINVAFIQDWYNLSVSGSMSIITLVVMALCLHRFAHHPDVQDLLQQARDEKNAESEVAS